MLSYSKLNQSFDFNWNDYRTIPKNQAKIDEIASIIKVSSYPEDSKSQQELGQLAYKAGTFYNHIKRDPHAAIETLTIAEQLLKNEERAWVQNHLAFSYQQKLAFANKSGNANEAEQNGQKAIEYCDQAINQFSIDQKTSLEQIKIIAFAYCVKALIEYENKQLDTALQSYRYALNLYEKHHLLDDQYIRAKNRWAMMLAENKQMEQAKQAFEEIEHYWMQHQDPLNPYPARFYVMYGDFLKNSHDDHWELALEKYQIAYEILKKIEGENSSFVKDVRKKMTAIITQKMTRFQVHVFAHTKNEELERTIQIAKDDIDHNENKHDSEYKENLKAVSIYYAFYKRHKELALTYLKKYQTTCTTEQEKIDALSLIAYVHTIDPNFIDEDNLFPQVLYKLDELQQEDKNSHHEITRAFAMQYQAMIIHRRAYFKKATNNNPEEALVIIDKAITIQSNLIATSPLLKIGLAESMHLKAVILYRLATLEQDENKKQHKLIEVEKILSQAAQLEEAFCQETKAPHFLIATTLQSLSRVLKNMGRSHETHVLYQRALDIQISMFGNKPHEDIAKTWHFWAETFIQEHHYEKAADAFLNALLIKYKINYANPDITKETEDALIASLEHLNQQNNTLAIQKCKEIYTALTNKENKKEFKHINNTFANVIFDKLIHFNRQKTHVSVCEQKSISALRSYSLYSVDPYFDSIHDTRSKIVESSQPDSNTPSLQWSSNQNLRR